MKAFIRIVVLSLWLHCVWSGLQCRDEENQPVDWFVALKLPRLKNSSNANVRSGIAYVYITSSALNDSWTLSSRTVDDTNSIMGNTLKPLYDDQVSNFARILYNDEPPHGNTTMTLGHTKGLAVGDNESGFWLVHSVPHFPPEAGNNFYSYPKTGKIYGQSFLCVTVLPKDLEIIGEQLMYNEPFIYDNFIPTALESAMPNFARAAQGETKQSAPWFNAAIFMSQKSQSFTSFAKSKRFGKDLYADWVAQSLQADLLVETWNHGPGAKMQSECEKPFKVENIESLTLNQFPFITGEDHSKWAVSSSSDQPWICVGDINRMEHQKQRGGGTVCLKNNQLFHAYRDSITGLDVCPAKPQ